MRAPGPRRPSPRLLSRTLCGIDLPAPAVRDVGAAGAAGAAAVFVFVFVVVVGVVVAVAAAAAAASC